MIRFFLFLGVAGAVLGQTQPAWVLRSNQNAQILIDLDAKYSPEGASANGMARFDDQVLSLAPDRPARLRADRLAAKKELEARLATEKDPLVTQDLEILLQSVGQELRRAEAGYPPLFEQAETRFRDKLATPGLLGPSRQLVEKNLENTSAYLTGISLLVEKYHLQNAQEPLAALKDQFAAWDAFVRKEVLPRSRADFRLPPAIYALQLENFGADYSPAELERLAHQGFLSIQAEMKPIAARIARQRRLPSSDYRAVLAALKKEQLKGEDVLPHYQKRLAEIEEVIRTKHLLTLPERPAMIRIATAAETAQQPAPHMQPPPMVNNHGERGAFVLPLETTGAGGAPLKYDDFTFAAASWTLTAHEARPGHELQFDRMVENGVSLARAEFAFNSTNVEGWGLYAEWFMLPYMPDEAKLVSLQFRLLRAARAFLDPELEEGKVTPEQAMKLLQKDVVCSEAFATEEVERFTFRMPGQAVSYFNGYLRLREIRDAAEKALGKNFPEQPFHDFILSQGLLPPSLLRKAVMEEFVVRSLAAGKPASDR